MTNRQLSFTCLRRTESSASDGVWSKYSKDQRVSSLHLPKGHLNPVVSNNTNELKTGVPGRFGLEVPRLGSPMEAKILGHKHARSSP